MGRSMIEILTDYLERGLLYKQTHPNYPLTIWNYSEKVQYETLWDEVTLSCRGLVTDEVGDICARPFKKFFNIEEGKHTPTSNFEVFEKVDGSLGILFNYKGEWIFASRGSFSSDQSVKFKEIFLSKYQTSVLDPCYTYLFEIIYPENIIVVRYDGLEDVILLGKIHTQSGQESDIENLRDTLNVVKKYDGISDYNILKNMVESNREGFVVRFSNGQRIKIKGEEYIRLHKILTNISTTSIWEIVSNKGDITTILKDVPDEYFNKIQDFVQDLHSKFESIRKNYFDLHDTIIEKVGTDRKLYALECIKYKNPNLLFAILDNKDISSSIWRILKPKFEKI